jgi:hypothetical protein
VIFAGALAHENVGHFALAAPTTHFYFAIRYPD